MTTQAQPSFDVELARLNTAIAVHIARVAELEAIVNRQRGERHTLTQLAHDLCQALAGDDNNITPDTAAALRALEQAVRT